MEEKKNKSHGGKRENAGRKNKFNEETIVLQITVPVRLKDKVKRMVNEYCKSY